MGFTIDSGNGGFLGIFLLLCAVGVGVVVLVTLLSAARRARRQVIDDEGEDKDLIA